MKNVILFSGHWFVVYPEGWYLSAWYYFPPECSLRQILNFIARHPELKKSLTTS